MARSSYEEFQQQYEDDAGREFAALSALPVAKLLDRVRAGKFGDFYHQLWPAIASKATLAEAGWVLFDVLESKADYLHRYHCAAALIKLAGTPLAAMTPVMLSVEKAPTTKENLETVRNVLTQLIGPQPPRR